MFDFPMKPNYIHWPVWYITTKKKFNGNNYYIYNQVQNQVKSGAAKSFIVLFNTKHKLY